MDQECGEELGIIFSESRGVPLTQASDARGTAEQDIAEGDKAGGRPRRGEDVSEKVDNTGRATTISLLLNADIKSSSSTLTATTEIYTV